MNISGIDSSTAAAYAGSQAQGTAASQDHLMSSVAQLLGVSTNQLQSDLASGKSLQSIASAQGVSSAQLVSGIAQSLQSSNPNLTPAQATAIATTVSQQAGGGGGHHHHHHGSGGDGSAASSSSTSSSTSVLNALMAALTSSSSPSSITSSSDEAGPLSDLLGTGATTADSASTAQGSLDTLL